MISSSPSSPTRSSTHSSKIEPPDPLHRHRRHPHRGLRAGVLLRAERRRPGLHPEDLLPARADGDGLPRRVRARRDLRDPAPAHPPAGGGPALVRRDPPVPDPRPRRAGHRLDLGARVVGALVGVERADARLVPDRDAAVRDLPAAALLDRGPRAPGALRERLRGRRGRVRPAELPRRAPRAGLLAPPRVRDGQRRPAAQDAADLLRLAAGHGAAVLDALALRDGGQARPRQAARAQAAAGRRRRDRARPQRGAAGLMPALPLHEAGKYVAAAYLVFLALILVYVAIMAVRLGRMERDLGELLELVEERDAERQGERVPS